MNPSGLVTHMTGAAPPPPPPVMPYPPPGYVPPPDAVVEGPWGTEDPLLWSARRARLHAMWGSAAIAFLVLLFGIGMYALFTAAIYEGDIEGNASLVVLLISPFLLAIVAAVATGALARNVGRMSKQPLAPSGARTARGVLWFGVFLWLMLLLVFPLSLTVQTGEGGDGDFPIGIVTVLPVYIGFCVAIYATGASYAAWSDNNKVECILIIGLGWAAFAMFLLLPAVINSWNLGAETPDVDWDSAVWWLRFGNLFPAIAPWLIVAGLYFVHNRSISLLEEEVRGDGAPAPPNASPGITRADSCPACGGSLSVHPKTLELFCGACGWGLQPEPSALELDSPLVVDATPAPTHMDDGFVEQTMEADPGFCGDCGNRMAVLTKTGRVYCPACGAGLPGSQRASEPPTGQEERPTPPPAPPSAAPVTPSPAQSPVPSSTPPTSTAPPPVPPPVSTPAPQAPPMSSAPGNCPLCGGRVAVHPRTGERFCPACGAGLRPEQ